MMRTTRNVVTGSGQRVAAVAVNTFREAIRNKVLAVLLMFAVALMAFSLVLGQLSLHEEVRIIKDLGLAGISIFSVIIALFLGVNLLSKELDRKTVYTMLSKPLYRWEFLLGKYVGLAVTMFSLVTLMAIVLAIFVSSKDGTHGVSMVRAEILILFELWLLMAVAMFFSSFSSPYLSAMLTAGLWVIGRNTGELEAFAERRLEGTTAGGIVEAVVAAVPDFRMFYVSGANLGDDVVSVHDSFITWGYVIDSGIYGLSYIALCLVGAAYLFMKRDFV